MRIIAYIIIVLFAYPVLAQSRREKRSNEKLIFEATVLKIGPKVPASGAIIQHYRLAKYHIERVCEGHYSGDEIVVDHFSLTREELSQIKPGDRVCVEVRVSKEMDRRENAEGIRDARDRVKQYYIGIEVVPLGQRGCKCKS